jgi:hypothetical protein
MTMATVQTPITIRRGSAAEVARAAIEQAERDGVERARMTLRMTLRDCSELKRDPKVATDDIAFGRGGMRFLGVLVEQGGVTVSTLDRGEGGGERAPIDPAPKVKAPRKKKAAAAATVD